MLSVSFLYDGNPYVFTAENVSVIEEAYNNYRSTIDVELPDINIQQDQYSAILTAPFKMTVESSDYKLPVNDGYAVCIEYKTIPVLPINNGIYLATITINGDYSLDYKIDLLSIIYSDITLTIANMYNELIQKGIQLEITSSTSINFKWIYDGNVIYMIFIDHNIATCPHLFTPKYFANKFEYFDEYLTEETEYTQSINLRWLDDLNTGTRVSKVNPQLSSCDGITLFIPPEEVMNIDIPTIPLQGKYVYYKLVNGNPIADIITAEEFLEMMYLPIDIDNIANEYNDNARHEIGTRAYTYYKGIKYNRLSQAYHPFYNDLYKLLANNYNKDFENMLIYEKQVVITSYLYVNKANQLIKKFINEYNEMSKEDISTYINNISNAIQTANRCVTSFNIFDVFVNILKLSDNFNEIIKKVKELNLSDNEFWM